MRTTNSNTAQACREFGLNVGDTIIGREFGTGRDAGKGWWGDAALTVAWIGERLAVFNVHTRDSDHPEWVLSEKEFGSWDLTWRDWHRAEPGWIYAKFGEEVAR